MGKYDFKARYREARRTADDAAQAWQQGQAVTGWQYGPAYLPGMDKEPPKLHLVEGAAWVAWLYGIALENARTLVNVDGRDWPVAVSSGGSVCRAIGIDLPIAVFR